MAETYENIFVPQGNRINEEQGKGKAVCSRSICLVLTAFALLLVADITVRVYLLTSSMEAQNTALQVEFLKTQAILADQKNTNEKLTKEITKLEKKVKDVQEEALKNCSAGWKYFNGKCYNYTSNTDLKNWADSRDACVTMGGHLVIIETPEEQDFLIKQQPANQYYWIGLTDAAKEQEWRWVDNRLLNNNAKYWSGNEPDNWEGGEHCATVKSGGERKSWNDVPCINNYKRICECKAK